MSPAKREDGTVPVQIRLSKRAKQVVQKKSENEYRSFGEQCRMIIDEWVEKQSTK